jgi:hypothetical protein
MLEEHIYITCKKETHAAPDNGSQRSLLRVLTPVGETLIELHALMTWMLDETLIERRKGNTSYAVGGL